MRTTEELVSMLRLFKGKTVCNCDFTEYADRLEAAEKLIEQLVDCLDNHAGNYKLTKAECVPVNEALAAAKRFREGG